MVLNGIAVKEATPDDPGWLLRILATLYIANR